MYDCLSRTLFTLAAQGPNNRSYVIVTHLGVHVYTSMYNVCIMKVALVTKGASHNFRCVYNKHVTPHMTYSARNIRLFAVLLLLYLLSQDLVECTCTWVYNCTSKKCHFKLMFPLSHTVVWLRIWDKVISTRLCSWCFLWNKISRMVNVVDWFKFMLCCDHTTWCLVHLWQPSVATMQTLSHGDQN